MCEAMAEMSQEAARLWALAQPTVSAFVTSQVRDIRDRDDVLQDVAVAVFDSIESYDRSRPFAGWAIRVARNQIRLYFRRKRVDRFVFDRPALDAIELAFADIQSREVRMLDYLEECVGSLDGRTKRLCEMRYGDDLKPAAIGPALGMSANNVAKALQRIREALRDCVEKKSILDGFGS